MYWRVTSDGAHALCTWGMPTGIVMTEGGRRVIYTDNQNDIPRYIELVRKIERSDLQCHTDTKKKH